MIKNKHYNKNDHSTKNNHSARKSLVKSLKQNKSPQFNIIAITGHNN